MSESSSSNKLAWVELPETMDWYHDLVADKEGFQTLATLLKNLAGINLLGNDKNRSLMAGRISKLLKKYQLTNYSSFIDLLNQASHAAVKEEFVIALTTNTTDFFREDKHFTILKELLLTGIKEKQFSPSREIRIWCAAASTGQEPYSILMTLAETLPGWPNWNIRILATDINMEVLEKAARGIYSSAEIKNVPLNYREKYFRKVKSSQEPLFAVKEELKSFIRFAPFNLLDFPYPFQFKFDFSFCRNVLIYFDKNSAIQVVETIGKAIKPGGFLFLGHAETGVNSPVQLCSIDHAVYKKMGKS